MATRSQKLLASIFYYTVLPFMNRFCTEQFIKCPCCGELLAKYHENGYLHMCDGDADCYGALGKGKGSYGKRDKQ